MRAVIDTCVILDYLQCREPFFEDSLNIAIGRANNEFEAYITASSLTDLYYIIHRHTHSSIETRRIISDIQSCSDWSIHTQRIASMRFIVK